VDGRDLSSHGVAVRAARAAAKAARKAAGAAKRGGKPRPSAGGDVALAANPAIVDIPARDGRAALPAEESEPTVDASRPDDLTDELVGADSEASEEDARARVRTVPEATVGRLAIYLRALTELAEKNTTTVSSEGLAAAAGVNSAKLRKDLSYLGSYGTRGVGYHVSILVEQISRVLGLNTHRSVALVGVGNLGHALAGYDGFASRGFAVAALFDADPARIGSEIGGLPVLDVRTLPDVVRAESVSIGVIATPAEAAQGVCDQLVAAGVTSILNFAPAVLSVPDGVDVRKVDLAVELQILSFHEERKAAGWEEVG
jgi:redox-sensing transcriptional repressor